MKSNKFILSVAAAGLLMAGCKNVDFKKTSGGVPYKVFGDNKKDTIGVNNIVKFEVIQRTKDTVLFSSYKESRPQYLQVPATPTTPPAYGDIKGNIVEILKQLHKGDSVYLTQSTDSLIKQNPGIEAQSPIKKGDQLITTIRITEVYKTPEEASAAALKDNLAMSEKAETEAYKNFNADTATQSQMRIDNKLIEDYLAANHIQAEKTKWGVYVQTIAPGQGPKPAPGQFASVKYRGTSLDGQEFDSGVYPLQIGTGGSVRGFEEGVKLLSKGGKSRIFIPSRLGYGPMGREPKIKKNQVLVFDLEMLDITNTPPAQPAMPSGQ